MPVHWDKSIETEKQIRVLIVDSHRPFAEGTEKLLSLEPRITTIGIAEDEASCFDMLRKFQPEVVLLDFYLKNICGLNLMTSLKKSFPSLKVIVMIDQSQEGYVLAASRQGADGLLMKTCSVEEMTQAIFSVINGGVYYSPSPSAFSPIEIDLNDLHFPVKPAAVLNKILTPEEKEIMRLLTKPLSNQEIAKTLGITVRAAEQQVQIILLKFGVRTRLEAFYSWFYVDR